jgi:hypothetical protein
MTLIALLNIWVQRIATAPPVVSERISDEQRATLRRRGLSVMLGAATAFVTSLFVPMIGQMMLFTIFLWRLLLNRIAPIR